MITYTQLKYILYPSIYNQKIKIVEIAKMCAAILSVKLALYNLDTDFVISQVHERLSK